ncbi:MAG: aminotransferase class V-fold PLP-dependent enzyme, partial [Pirellula sp.]|nr:aminotransferase class V-fold PLP-dependent enzyme [Pirellula sp.]
EMLCLPGCGASVMEISHRSKQFMAIQEAAKQRIIRLLGVPDSYDVLFLQGGSRLQFSMIPMNLLRGHAGPAQYVLTGSWGKYALAEAKKEGATEVIFDAAATNYDRLPGAGELKVRSDAAYVHVQSSATRRPTFFIDRSISRSMACCTLVLKRTLALLVLPLW